MKKILKIALVLLGISVILGIVALVMGANKNSFLKAIDSIKEYEKVELSYENNVDTLKVDFKTLSVKLIVEEREDIKVLFYNAKTHKVNALFGEGVLSLEEEKIKTDYFNLFNYITIFQEISNKETVVVYVPLINFLKNIDIKEINADIKLENIDLEKIDIKTTNGDISLENVKSDILKINTTNGDIDIKNIDVAYIEIFTVNGEVKIKEIYFDKMSIKTTNSDVSIKNINNDILQYHIKLDTTNGKIVYNSDKHNNHYEQNEDNENYYLFIKTTNSKITVQQ
ncbi:MAG: DUF4097 domain-containing protein [Acholeplasmatales bacterium]|jgi:hypothetical protein|nr:DUF4097 domain-containing protein [Acholeplasmatales bacterium]